MGGVGGGEEMSANGCGRLSQAMYVRTCALQSHRSGRPGIAHEHCGRIAELT